MTDQVKANYGFAPCSITKLDGDINYSNQKYLLSDDSGNRYILKIYTDAGELALAKEEHRIINLIKDRIEFEIPMAQPGKNGNLFTTWAEGEAILLKYIEGDFIAGIEQTDTILYSFGKCIAGLHLALKGEDSIIFRARKNFWDLQHSHINYDKSKFITDPSVKKHVDYYFNRFHSRVLPDLHKFRYSLIHGDLNDYNVLSSGDKIKGFIDFGDLCYSLLINELAVAASYVMMNKPDPLESLMHLIRGFHELVPLERREVILLPDLITTRLCVSICNTAEKRAKSEDNEYVLISEKPAIELLKAWKKTGHIARLNILLNSLGMAPVDYGSDKSDVFDRRNRIISKVLSLSYTSPIHMDSSLFQYMYDKQGNTYLDAYNNIPHVGHSHPHVAAVISGQSYRLNTNTRYLFNSLVDYGERILEYFPENLNKIFFVNSGSAASDLAIRLARKYTERNHIIVMEHGYHGNTSTGISISPYKFDGKGGSGLPEDITKLPLPNEYNCQLSGEEYARNAIVIIDNLVSTGIIPAAFISEPVSGCGGQVPLAKNYLKSLYPYLKKHGIVTISDEVQVGFGRLGSCFWGYEMHGVSPDMVILGKPMGNGHPIGAVITTSEIADAFSSGMEFFSSFGGNPVSCEAARAVLDVIENEGLQENAHKTGNYYLESLRELSRKHKTIGDVRGSGLFIGLEFTLENGEPGTLVASKVKNRLKDEFILTGTDGPYDNVIKSKPPMCFNRQNVDRVVQTLDKVLKNL